MTLSPLAKKEREAIELRISVAMDEAMTLVGMKGQWEIDVIFDEGFDGDGEWTEDNSVKKTTAITTAQWKYQRATIRWFLRMAALGTDDRLRAVAVHELVHCLMNSYDELIDWSKDDGLGSSFCEFTTENLTRAILHASGHLSVG